MNVWSHGQLSLGDDPPKELQLNATQQQQQPINDDRTGRMYCPLDYFDGDGGGDSRHHYRGDGDRSLSRVAIATDSAIADAGVAGSGAVRAEGCSNLDWRARYYHYLHGHSRGDLLPMALRMTTTAAASVYGMVVVYCRLLGTRRSPGQ